jgi:hypothetical protein
MPAACHNLVVQPNRTAFFDNQTDATACGGTTTAGGVTAPNFIGVGGPGTPTVIAAVMQPLLAQFPSPSPNLPSLVNNFTYPFTQPSTDDYGQMRVDQTLSDKDSLFVRYTIQNTTQTQPTAFPQFASSAYSRNQFLTLSENRIFSQALLNTFRTSFSRTYLNWVLADAPGVNSPQLSLVQGLDMGDISITNYTTIGAAGTSPRLEKQNIFTWSDDVYYTRGHHAFKFGTLINHYQQEIVNSQSYTGIANFTTLGTFLAGNANFIRALTPGSKLNRTYHFNTVGFYAQDDWRVLPRLTLNLGLRYEFNTSPVEANGQFSVIKNLATDTAPVVSATTFLNPSLKNFSPRVGFAWDVTGNGKMAVRGGFDYLYDLVDLQTGANLLQTQIATPPFSNRLQANNFNLADPVTGGLPFKFPASTSSLAYRPTQWNMNQPAMFVYNLSVERQLPFEMSLSVTYAGSEGRHLMQEREGNPVIPQGIPLGGACVVRPAGQPINTASMVDNNSATACFLPADAVNSRRNLNFGSTDYFVSGGTSNYNALQVGLIKRMSKGLQLQSSFTWSKMLDNNTNITGEFASGNSSYGIDPLHPSLDYGPSLTDVTDVWKLNAIYQIPKIMSAEGLVAKLLNGWWASGILSLQSGLPFSPDLNTNRSASGVGGGTGGLDRPDLVAGRNSYNIVHGASTANGTDPCPTAGLPLGTPNLYFDPCAYTIPTAGFLGTAGRDMLRGPGFGELDFSVVKDTKLGLLGESGALQFRAEIFNITNHANFSLPNRVTYAGNTSVQSPTSTAGVISTTSGTSRQVQLALKVLF